MFSRRPRALHTVVVHDEAQTGFLGGWRRDTVWQLVWRNRDPLMVPSLLSTGDRFSVHSNGGRRGGHASSRCSRLGGSGKGGRVSQCRGSTILRSILGAQNRPEYDFRRLGSNGLARTLRAHSPGREIVSRILLAPCFF